MSGGGGSLFRGPCRRWASCVGTGRGICGLGRPEGRSVATGRRRLRRRRRPPRGSGSPTAGCNAEPSPAACRRTSCCHGADVARQFADEEGDLRLVQGRRLQGGQVVPEHRGPGLTAAHRVQPLVGSLLVGHAVGFQEEVLQLLVRVGDGGGVARQRADGRDERRGA